MSSSDPGPPKYSGFPAPQDHYGPGREPERQIDKRARGRRKAKEFPAWVLIFIGLYNLILGIFRYDLHLWVIAIGGVTAAFGFWWLRRIRRR